MANEKKMDCVILGLLSHEPLTGYEIKKRVDTALKFFWSASYGSIYPTLGELTKSGKITKRQAKENGRDKMIYTITDAGREFLRAWLHAPVVKDELRYETLLKLFFGEGAGTAPAIGHINAFESKIRAQLPFLKAAVGQLTAIRNTQPAHVYYLLTAKFGVKAYEAYLEWCAEAAAALNALERGEVL